MNQRRTRGCFLALEGIDGVGKTTQVTMLARRLRDEGRRVLVCREPGGTDIGEQIRELLLNPESQIAPMTEMLLYMACRAQLLDEVIAPALAEGAIVISDRFLLSTIVYQGMAGTLAPKVIRTLGDAVTQGITPDWTGVLDADVAVAQARRQGPQDRIESRGTEYQARVREGFRSLALAEPGRITLLDASGAPEVVHQAIYREVSRVLTDHCRA